MATKGHGAKLYYGNAGSSPLTQIAKVKSMTVPVSENPDIDISHLESEAREFMAGLVDNGEFEGVIQYASAQDTTLRGMQGVDKSYGIVFSDGSELDWEGYIKKIGIDGIEIDGEMTNTVTIKVSGPLETGTA